MLTSPIVAGRAAADNGEVTLSLVKTFHTQGAEAAFRSFPKPLRDAISTLGKQLEADPTFNNPQAMQQLMKTMLLLAPRGLNAGSEQP
jgi:hypothetical protein